MGSVTNKREQALEACEKVIIAVFKINKNISHRGQTPLKKCDQIINFL